MNAASARACAVASQSSWSNKRFVNRDVQIGGDLYCGYIDRNRVKNSCYELNRLRVSAYLDVLDRGGPDVSVRIWEWHRSNEEGGRIAGESLLKEHPRPTATRQRAIGWQLELLKLRGPANSAFPKISL